MILIVSSVMDAHARCVAQELEKLGEAVFFLDMSHCGSGTLVEHQIGRSGAPLTLTTEDGTLINLCEVSAVWHRRPQRPRFPSDLIDIEDRNFANLEWIDALDSLLLSIDARHMNPLWSQRAALKPRQLEIARRLGLRIPATLVTNDPLRVNEFLTMHRNNVVYKSLTAPNHCFLATRRWSETDGAALVDLPISPAIFQEEIIGPSDVRVTIVGQEIFAARIDTSASRPSSDRQSDVDSRLDLDAPYELHDLPESIAQLLRELMSELGLVFGTIDLKITNEGDHVFLEVNPQGQFLYVEILTGLPITLAVARFLAGRS